MYRMGYLESTTKAAWASEIRVEIAEEVPERCGVLAGKQRASGVVAAKFFLFSVREPD